MRYFSFILLVFSANIGLSQITTFPYSESFEVAFLQGENIAFIPHWTGNEVATNKRIFQGNDPRTGASSLNIIPTSSFKGEVLISLNLTGISNPKIQFYAYSKKNGSSSSSRPTLLTFETSIDGGTSFHNPTIIGDETTFPNNNESSYALFTFYPDASAAYQSNVVIKLTAARGAGVGSAAELILDDFKIENEPIPLDIVSTAPLSNTSLLITFNQAVTQITAEAINNYNIDNGVAVFQAQLTAINQVQLTTAPMPNNHYQLTVNNVEDANTSTPASNLQSAFTYAEALTIDSIKVTTKNVIELYFNLDLDQVSAETTDNYMIDHGIGMPITAVLGQVNKRKVTLTLESGLNENNYTTTVNGVKDISTLSTTANLLGNFNYKPLKIALLKALSNHEIQVVFNQNVESVTANSLSNYELNFAFGNPNSIAQNPGIDSVVVLSYTSGFVNNTYTLTINNVRNDLDNSQALSLQSSFIHAFPTGLGQIRINEIFADPTGNFMPDPQVLPNSSSDEFIELFNATSKAIDLNDFALSEGKIAAFVLEPNSYVILTAHNNVAEFQPFGKVVGVSSWNTLTNSGEPLVLRDNLGNTVDSLTYNFEWYKDESKSDGGWSLEQISPYVECNDIDNWSTSTNAIGGSPGDQNSIFDPSPDLSGPQVSNLIANSTTALHIVFNEAMDVSSLVPSNFVLEDGVQVSSVDLNDLFGRSVTLHLNQEFQKGILRNLTLNNIFDCAGNLISNNQYEFFIGKAASFQELVITEIMATPSPVQGLPDVEYLELFNASDQIITLSNVMLADATGSTLLPEYTIYPGAYVILVPASVSNALAGYGSVLPITGWRNLNFISDHITLSIHDQLIFEVAYSSDWYRSEIKASGGYSLEMIDTHYPCYEALNWTASESELGGTPGSINSVSASNPDIIGPSLIDAMALSDHEIQLVFDEKLKTDNISKDNFEISPTLSISELIIEADQRTIILTTDKLLQNTVYEINTENISDCSGNLVLMNGSSQPLIIPSIAEPLDLIINEVLFNPKSGGTRFVEIFNKSDKYINLNQWSLAGIDNQRIITDRNLIIGPGSFSVITKDAATLKNHYPKTDEATLVEISSMPKMSSEEGAIGLLDDLGQTIDSMNYSEDYHSALLEDVDGVSLEKIRPNSNSLNPDNWFSASASEGSATPGYLNSQFMKDEISVGKITIVPRAFSPDQSGYTNFTTINYSFDEPGNVVTITIYDSLGNRVRVLTKNSFVGTSGFFTWDGTTQRGGKARIGYYMILIEVITSEGKPTLHRESVAIGRRFDP